MKIQDVTFIIVLLSFLISRRDHRWFVSAGLISFGISIPLFSEWIFFTAERRTWYAAVFIVIGILLLLFRKNQS